MGGEIRLFANTDCLLIEQYDDEDWFMCTLLVGARKHYLGADVGRCVFPRLLDAVTGSAEVPPWTVDGIPVRAAMTLVDGHSTLYAGRVGGDTVLLWQTSDAEWLPRLIVTAKEADLWREQFERWLCSHVLDVEI